MWHVTRVTDAFRYGLQKEVDTSRRSTILRRTVDEGEFSALIFGHCMCAYLYSCPASGPQPSTFYRSSRVPAHAFAFHPVPSPICALSIAPLPIASLLRLSPLPHSLSYPSQRSPRSAFLCCTDTCGLRGDPVPARRGAASSTPGVYSVSPYASLRTTQLDTH